MHDLMVYHPLQWLCIWGFFILLVVGWLASIASVLTRRDLPAAERLLWFFVTLLLPVVGALFYFRICPRRPNS